MFIKRWVNTVQAQRGDTIVEVLIAITVVSMVLGGAYVTTNKSLLATRSAQEHATALKLVESQLEQIKGLAITNPNAIFTGPSPFCVYNQTTVVSTTDPRCTQSAAGVATTTDPKFNLAITRNGNEFTVKNSWTDVTGKLTDQLSLKYRLYQ